MDTQHPSQSRERRAFTLIELLTVIAIIGILAAIIIPTVGRVRETAKVSVGVSNLRQITMSTLVYANDNKGFFPYPQGGNKFFYTILTAYLENNDRDTNQFGRYSPIFRDPLATISSGDNHYTANNNLMGYTSPKTLNQFREPSRTAVYFDGAQYLSGNTDVAGWAVDGGTLNDQKASVRPLVWLETAVALGPNLDTARANIRWRMPGNKAKFSFLDGRCVVLSQSEVKRRFFVLD